MAWHAKLCCQICQSLGTLSPDSLLPGQDRRESLKDSFCPARLFLRCVLVVALSRKSPYPCVKTEINRMNKCQPMPVARGPNACGVSPNWLVVFTLLDNSWGLSPLSKNHAESKPQRDKEGHGRPMLCSFEDGRCRRGATRASPWNCWEAAAARRHWKQFDSSSGWCWY